MGDGLDGEGRYGDSFGGVERVAYTRREERERMGNRTEEKAERKTGEAKAAEGMIGFSLARECRGGELAPMQASDTSTYPKLSSGHMSLIAAACRFTEIW